MCKVNLTKIFGAFLEITSNFFNSNSFEKFILFLIFYSYFFQIIIINAR